jgi:hypothetical protein
MLGKTRARRAPDSSRGSKRTLTSIAGILSLWFIALQGVSVKNNHKLRMECIEGEDRWAKRAPSRTSPGSVRLVVSGGGPRRNFSVPSLGRDNGKRFGDFGLPGPIRPGRGGAARITCCPTTWRECKPTFFLFRNSVRGVLFVRASICFVCSGFCLTKRRIQSKRASLETACRVPAITCPRSISGVASQSVRSTSATLQLSLQAEQLQHPILSDGYVIHLAAGEAQTDW